MHHQFKELADVDITAEPMEVGPTCHYVMGGVEVDPDTGAALVPGLFAAGEVSGGMHGSNRLGGNSLSDLLVFGRRAGLGAAEYATEVGTVTVPESEVEAAMAEALAPYDREGGENLPVLRAERSAGRMPEGAVRALAAWISHLRGAGAPVTDPRADELVARAAGPLPEAVKRILEDLDPALAADDELVASVRRAAR